MNKFRMLLILILFIAFIFRFYRLHEWIFFGMDQEYEALIVQNLVTGKHWPLIGVNVSDTGLYLGPAFIYFAAIPYILFKGNPWGLAVIASSLGVLVTYSIYKIGRKMFSEKVGLVSAFFYASSFLASFYDRQFWNPMFVSLFSLLIGYLLYQLYNKRIDRLPRLFTVFGLSIQTHLSLLIFAPLIFYILWRLRKIISKKIFIISLSIFIIIQSPILLFETRHNFLNTRAFIHILSNQKSMSFGKSTILERNGIFLSSLGRYFIPSAGTDLFLESGQCSELRGLVKSRFFEGFTILLIFLSVYFFWKREHKLKKYQHHMNFLSTAMVMSGIIGTSFLFIESYNHKIFEYYFLYLFPWIAIAGGLISTYILSKKFGKLIFYIITFMFLLSNLITLFTSSMSYSYREKTEAITWVKHNLSGKTYSLEALGECPRYGGYRYLFSYFIGFSPIHSYMDSYFDWLYNDTIKNSLPDQKIILSLIDPREPKANIGKWEEEKIRLLIENKVRAESRFGRIQVFILKNEK